MHILPVYLTAHFTKNFGFTHEMVRIFSSISISIALILFQVCYKNAFVLDIASKYFSYLHVFLFLCLNSLSCAWETNSLSWWCISYLDVNRETLLTVKQQDKMGVARWFVTGKFVGFFHSLFTLELHYFLCTSLRVGNMYR